MRGESRIWRIFVEFRKVNQALFSSLCPSSLGLVEIDVLELVYGVWKGLDGNLECVDVFCHELIRF